MYADISGVINEFCQTFATALNFRICPLLGVPTKDASVSPDRFDAPPPPEALWLPLNIIPDTSIVTLSPFHWRNYYVSPPFAYTSTPPSHGVSGIPAGVSDQYDLTFLNLNVAVGGPSKIIAMIA